MKIKDRVRQAVETAQMDEVLTKDIDKLIALAYYIGRESATIEVSDKYNKLIAQQNERADKCRYYKMAKSIIGDKEYIYNSDYRGDMTSMFGDDETEL